LSFYIDSSRATPGRQTLRLQVEPLVFFFLSFSLSSWPGELFCSPPPMYFFDQAPFHLFFPIFFSYGRLTSLSVFCPVFFVVLFFPPNTPARYLSQGAARLFVACPSFVFSWRLPSVGGFCVMFVRLTPRLRRLFRFEGPDFVLSGPCPLLVTATAASCPPFFFPLPPASAGF